MLRAESGVSCPGTTIQIAFDKGYSLHCKHVQQVSSSTHACSYYDMRSQPTVEAALRLET
eukprot:197553-Chlamydomonas_euryale.AAC.1